MKFTASAKVNLSLHITGRREDGYHNLSSLVVFTKFGDMISAHASRNLTIRFLGEFSLGLNPLKNSIIDAVRWFERRTNKFVHYDFIIEKNIPVMAGLGGGTADAAAVLRFLYEQFYIPLPTPSELSELGADVPVSFFDRTALMAGIGGKLRRTNIDLNLDIILINPRHAVSTAQAFSNMKTFDQPIDFQNSYNLNSIKSQTNSMQKPAIELCPQIGEIVEFLHDQPVELVRMTGSGATVFALVKGANIQFVVNSLRNRYSDFWIVSTQIKRSTT